MKFALTSLVLLISTGRASAEAPPPAPPSTPPPSTTGATQTLTSAPAPSASSPTAPTPEDAARAQEQKQLAEDFAKLEQANAAELARITPEIRAAAKKLTEKSAAGIKTAVKDAQQSPHRRPGHAERDAQRRPGETLSFLGVIPSHSVLEYGPGEGWYTELLAPSLAKRGKLYVTLNDPTGPMTERATFYGKRTQLQLDSLPEAYGAVERVVVNPQKPALTIPDDTLDVVLLFRGAHGMANSGTLDTWLSEFHRTLKPRGILGIEQHRAAAGAVPAESSKSGYLPEAFVIEQVQKAGFKLAAKSELNANPKDTRDHINGVWSLPPTLAGGETDREKYTAMGESDRMTLKFIKTDRPKTAAPAFEGAATSAKPSALQAAATGSQSSAAAPHATSMVPNAPAPTPQGTGTRMQAPTPAQ